MDSALTAHLQSSVLATNTIHRLCHYIDSDPLSAFPENKQRVSDLLKKYWIDNVLAIGGISLGPLVVGSVEPITPHPRLQEDCPVYEEPLM